MGTRLLLGLALTGLLLRGPADAGVIIAVDEHGDGVGTLGGGSLAPDPGPGGLPAVLTYRLPFAGTVGDVYLTEPVQVFSDVIRFNGTRTLVFYSSSADGFDSLADTLGPPAIPYANFALIPEVGTGNNHAATYTPGPGQPGYDPVAQPTYNFVSDGFVAEPSSVVMGGTAALLGLGCWWRHRHRARAEARGLAVGRRPRQDARGVVGRSKPRHISPAGSSDRPRWMQVTASFLSAGGER
jgi:hypothetical protein